MSEQQKLLTSLGCSLVAAQQHIIENMDTTTSMKHNDIMPTTRYKPRTPFT
jgi:hypothetical protein